MPRSTSRLSAVETGALSAQLRAKRACPTRSGLAAPGCRRKRSVRLRSRSTCDFTTLDALPGGRCRRPRRRVLARGERALMDVAWPAMVDRSLECRLVDAARLRLNPHRRLASALHRASFSRGNRGDACEPPQNSTAQKHLDLAESLHPGATEPRVFAKWLAETPLPPRASCPCLKQSCVVRPEPYTRREYVSAFRELTAQDRRVAGGRPVPRAADSDVRSGWRRAALPHGRTRVRGRGRGVLEKDCPARWTRSRLSG